MATGMEMNKERLLSCALKGKWEEVIRLYGEDPRLHKVKITKSGDTALHLAVSDGNEEVVEQMVKLAGSWPQHCKEALETQNDRDDTALHIAASMGNVRMCQLIAQKHPSLVAVRNVDGETPLFLAALNGGEEAFLCLHYFLPNYHTCRRKDGDTILHCAIAGGFYDLAFQIIHLHEDLVNTVNEKGLSPLHLLAAKPSDFKSGSRLGLFERIIYHCIIVDELEVAQYLHQQPFSEAPKHKANCHLPDNYRTCCDIFGIVKTSLTFDKLFPKGQPSNAEDPEEAEYNNITSGSECRAHETRQLYPENYESCCKIFRFVYQAVILILGQGLKGIRRKKEKHVWSFQIMNELLSRASLYEYENNGNEPQAVDFASYIDHGNDNQQQDESTLRNFYHASLYEYGNIGNEPQAVDFASYIDHGNYNQQQDKGGKENIKMITETPILIAAKNGVTEMVEKILELFPAAIQDKNVEKKNVVLLAVEHRQPKILEALHRYNKQKYLIQSIDTGGNSILHLAAKYELQILGSSALQMQHEIKWYEHVKSFLPSYFTFLTNKKGETPEEIFQRHHKDLFEKSDHWLSRTSESCSVVAALVAGVAFATSSTVPGGNDDKTGKPTLEGQAGFNVFAITALMALCFSVTALILFLSILTSRRQPADFMKKLPVKLFLALSSLFVSIFSMFISFCAAHSFVLEDKFKKVVLPLYVIVCLPVAFTIIEFPLYVDLLEGILMKVQPTYDKRRA